MRLELCQVTTVVVHFQNKALTQSQVPVIRQKIVHRPMLNNSLGQF